MTQQDEGGKTNPSAGKERSDRRSMWIPQWCTGPIPVYRDVTGSGPKRCTIFWVKRWMEHSLLHEVVNGVHDGEEASPHLLVTP